MYRKLGIVGGMGPEATHSLHKGLINGAGAKNDQEHLDLVIINDPKIPDRTKAILYDGPSPVPFIVEDCRICAAAGCDIIAVPCNTAHYFFEEIQARSPVPVLNMIELVADELEEAGIQKAFIMATEGTTQSGLYEDVLGKRGIVLVRPSSDELAILMKVIYEIKAGAICTDAIGVDSTVEDLDRLVEMVVAYCSCGCERIILGCTELSLVVEYMTARGIAAELFVDSIDVLTQAILRGFGR